MPAVVVLVAALAWWEGGRSRDSAAAHDSVAAAIVVAAAAAVVLGRGRQRTRSGVWLAGAWPRHLPRSRYEAGVAVWAVLITAVVGWDLVSFIAQAHTLPTLSYWIGHVTRYRAGRAAVFALWLGLGGYLAAGWRAPER